MVYRQRAAGMTSRGGGRTVPSNEAGTPTPVEVITDAKQLRIAQLWAACDAYERQFYSGGVHAQILELKLKGDAKAVACQHWTQGLWRDYYARCDAVNAALTPVEINAVGVDFSNHAAPPYTVRQLFVEMPIV